MADPFLPRFADLVRNFTSSTGTGNLVLDEAPPGFTSFGAALQPGDSFYYSVAGIDVPAETEVGRGTLQADGSIARQPITGPLTDFTAGRKSVALVAAAEWFEGASAAGGSAAAATVEQLSALPESGAALLYQQGREGLFAFDPDDLSTKVSADVAGGIFVAPASDPTGASGAWVRHYDGWLKPEWFGAKGDGTTNDQPAFDALNSLIAVLGGASIQLREGATYLVGKQTSGGSFYRSGANAIYASGLSHFILDLNGATLKTNPGLLYGRFDAATGLALDNWTADGTCPANERAEIGMMIRISSTPNVHIFNGTLDGNSAAQSIGGSPNTAGYQLAHYGLHIRDCDQVAVDNVHGFNFLLDGWYYDWTALTEADEAKPFAMRNCRFHNVGRNVGTVSAGNCVLLENVCHKYHGAPKSGGGLLGSAPKSALDIEAQSGSVIRNVRIVGGTYEQGLIGSSALVAGSGDTKDVLIDGAHLIGVVWLGMPRCVVRNSRVNGYFGVLLGGQTDPTDNALIDNCQVSDVTYGDTPQLNAGGHLVSGNAYGEGVTIRDSAFRCQFSRLNLRGMRVSGTTFRIAFGTEAFADRSYFALVDSGAELRRVTFADEIGANIPADGFYASGANASDVEECEIVSAAGKLKWNSWSAGSLGYSGRYDNHAVARKELQTQKRLGGGGGFYGSASIRFNDTVPADSPGAGSLTLNESPSAGDALGWRYLASGTHEPVYAGVRALGFHCAGTPAASETIAGAIAPYAMTVSATKSRCKALVAASAAATLAIKNNGTQIGQVDFAAGATTGTISLSTGSIAAGDHITVHNAAVADATLADIDGLLSE